MINKKKKVKMIGDIKNIYYLKKDLEYYRIKLVEWRGLKVILILSLLGIGYISIDLSFRYGLLTF